MRAPAPAGAQLPSLPSLEPVAATTLTGTVTGTLPTDGALPDLAGVVSSTTGTVGGLIAGTTSTATGALEDTLAQVTATTGGLLPPSLLTLLLGQLQPAAGAVPGTTSSGPPSTTIDARAPNARFRVLSRLRRVARTGRLRVRVSLDEAGIAVLSSTLRPGLQTKAARRKHRGRRYSRRPLHFPSVALAFHGSGSLDVAIRLSRRVQRRLARARDARMSVAIVTADLRRNQAASRQKKRLRR